MGPVTRIKCPFFKNLRNQHFEESSRPSQQQAFINQAAKLSYLEHLTSTSPSSTHRYSDLIRIPFSVDNFVLKS